MIKNHRGKILDFNVLNTAMSFASVAYGVSALSRKNRFDYAQNTKYGLSGAQSFTANVRKHLLMAKDPYMRQSHWDNTHDDLDPKDIQLPILTGLAEKDFWSYDADAEQLKNYHISKLWGLVNTAGKGVPALLGLVFRPKMPTVSGVAVAPPGVAAPDNRVYIAFKGTQGGVGSSSAVLGLFQKAAPEWNTDMDRALVPFGDSPGKVHNGFSRAFMSLVAYLEEVLDDLPPDQPIVVVGHSLGGALATLAAYYLKKYLLYRDVTLVSLAEPRIGDRAFVKDIEATLQDKMFTYYIKGDVANVAPPFSAYTQSLGAIEMATATRLHLPLNSSEAHYFESVRFLLYYGYGKLADYRPIIQQYVQSVGLPAPSVKLLTMYPTITQRWNFRNTEVSGRTYVTAEELHALFPHDYGHFRAYKIWLNHSPIIISIAKKNPLLDYYCHKILIPNIQSTPDPSWITDFLILFFLIMNGSQSLELQLVVAKELKEWYHALTVHHKIATAFKDGIGAELKNPTVQALENIQLSLLSYMIADFSKVADYRAAVLKPLVETIKINLRIGFTANKPFYQEILSTLYLGDNSRMLHAGAQPTWSSIIKELPEVLGAVAAG